MPATKKVEPRYIDGLLLKEFLARRFPGQICMASVSGAHFVPLTSDAVARHSLSANVTNESALTGSTWQMDNHDSRALNAGLL